MFDWEAIRQHLRGHGPNAHLLDALPLPDGQDGQVQDLWWLLCAFERHHMDMDPQTLFDWNEAAQAVVDERLGVPLTEGQRELLEPIAYWRLLAKEMRDELSA